MHDRITAGIARLAIVTRYKARWPMRHVKRILADKRCRDAVFIFALMMITLGSTQQTNLSDWFAGITAVVAVFTAFLVVKQLDIIVAQDRLLRHQHSLLTAKPSLK